jgi:protein required for attachment to host cells
MYWIVLADSALFRIYSYEQKTKQLSLLAEKYHPESRAKIIDLAVNNVGHYKTRTKARGAYSSRTNPKQEEIESFLKILVEQIEAGRISNQYKKFILIALPRVVGFIVKHLSEATQRLMGNNIKKDYVHLPEQEFRKFLQTRWRELVG